MSKKVIITIARQYGSGGREIGERVAKLLGIPLYDKEIIHDADLTIPHPLILQREFVYRPLFEIAPEAEQFLQTI